MVIGQYTYLVMSVLALCCCTVLAKRSSDFLRQKAMLALIGTAGGTIHHVLFVVYSFVFCSDTASTSTGVAPYGAVMVAWVFPNMLLPVIICIFLNHLKVLREVLVKQNTLVERPQLLMAMDVASLADWFVFVAGYIAIGLTNSAYLAGAMYLYRAAIVFACGCISLWYMRTIARILKKGVDAGPRDSCRNVQLKTFGKFRRKAHAYLGLCMFAVGALFYRGVTTLRREHYVVSENLELCQPVPVEVGLAYAANYIAIYVFVFAFCPKKIKIKRRIKLMLPPKQNMVHPKPQITNKIFSVLLEPSALPVTISSSPRPGQRRLGPVEEGDEDEGDEGAALTS